MQFAVVICAVFSVIYLCEAVPVHNGIMYYQHQQQPYYAPRRQYPVHQAMLVHYGQQYQSRSPASEIAAFAAGESVGAGSYLQEDEPIAVPYPQADQPTYLDDGNAAVSVAEAFPESDEPQFADALPAVNEVVPAVELDAPAQDSPKRKAPKEYLPPSAVAEEVQPIADDADQNEADEPAAVAPVAAPAQKKKKNRVELEAEDDEEEEFVPFNTKAQKPNKPSSGNGGANQYPWPVNTFFPVNFGSTAGGAIAVANSFSTGKGGTATSHATAYGSAPSKQKLKKRLSDQE